MKGKKQVLGIIEWLVVLALVISSVVVLRYIITRTDEVKEMVNMKDSKLVLYEGPKSLKDATEADLKTTGESLRDFTLKHCIDTKVSVNGYDCYVYDTNVNHTRQWVSDYMPPQSRTPITYFDFEGVANIKVTVPGIDLETVTISPVSANIKPVIDTINHSVSFTITKPDTYTVTFNDSPQRAVHIFANPIETNKPSKDDENVVYIGPGEWNIESIILSDNQILYLEGGAVVHGIINASYAKNVKVCGRGIIDGSSFAGWMGKTAYIPLKFDNCDGVEIRDIIA
ncbi:MAG: hypothetical protein K0S41_3028, partial [Anaerocolumna sp.]|nr:hypothetical protein [Anaerocolumna sp.]